MGRMYLSGLAWFGLLLLAVPAAAQKQLWLIGGGEPVCSSIEPEFCRPEAKAEAERYFAEHEALRGKSFRFTDKGLKTLQALPRWFGTDVVQQQKDLQKLADVAASVRGQALDEKTWHSLLEPLQLSEDLLQLYDDAFELRPLTRAGTSAKSLTYLKAGEPYVEEMFRQFVAAAASNPLRAKTRPADPAAKPRIIVLTASSNNPYEYVDYYLSLFDAVGADARWLPLEPALPRTGDCRQLNALRFEWNGAYDRAARYPELAAYQKPFCEQPQKLLDLIDSADGIFINGGDQSLTMRALQQPYGEFTAIAKRLLARVEAGVPLVGSSAGTAVQSGHPRAHYPMISGGQSRHALQHGALANEPNSPACDLHKRCSSNTADGQLTYRALGGLQVFTLGVSDTHFRERDREGRLLRLLLDTHSHFGFGVDEATALRAIFHDDDSASLSVLGKGGVWLLDTRQARVSKTIDSWTASGFVASRLLSGDHAEWRAGELTATLQCEPSARLAPALLPDAASEAEAFAERPDRKWSRLATDAAISGCQRSDGRWRYLSLPMQLQVPLNQ